VIQINLDTAMDLPMFTVEEQRRINDYYKKMHAKYDPARAGIRWAKPPADYYRDNADKVRHYLETAGNSERSLYY
jgi:hypothetical protein